MYTYFKVSYCSYILLQLNEAVDTLLDALKDPSLPLLEIQVCVVVPCDLSVIPFIMINNHINTMTAFDNWYIEIPVYQ